MSERVFANQMASQPQIEQIVRWLVQPPATKAWALIDAALLDEGRFRNLVARSSARIHSAFAASALSAFGKYAPHLLELPEGEALLLAEAMRLVRLAGDATAISWLHSDQPVASLQQLFAYLAKVQVEDRKAPIHCRFADVRVLPELLKVLMPPQRQRIASVIAGWSWAGRTGDPEFWSPESAGSAQADTGTMLRLSVQQFRALQHAAEADGIFLMLSQKTPELVPAANLGEFHGRLRNCLDKASDLQVVDAKDRLQFVVLSLTSGDDFYRLPELQGTWRQLADRRGNLVELMQGWDDALWAKLESEREALRA